MLLPTASQVPPIGTAGLTREASKRKLNSSRPPSTFLLSLLCARKVKEAGQTAVIEKPTVGPGLEQGAIAEPRLPAGSSSSLPLLGVSRGCRAGKEFFLVFGFSSDFEILPSP